MDRSGEPELPPRGNLNPTSSSARLGVAEHLEAVVPRPLFSSHRSSNSEGSDYSSRMREYLTPRPLFSHRNSQQSASSKSSDYSSRMQEYLSKSNEPTTEEIDSSEPPSLMKLLTDEIDAEIAAQDANYHEDSAAEKASGSQLEAIGDSDTEVDEGCMEEILDALDVEIYDWLEIQAPSPKQNLQPRTPRQSTPSLCVSKPKDWAVAEAIASAQAFRASPEFLAYQTDQEQRVTSFKETSSWRQYEADLALILDYTEWRDLEGFSEPSSTVVSNSSQAPASAGMAKLSPRKELRRVGM